jgi:hypothetical protein
MENHGTTLEIMENHGTTLEIMENHGPYHGESWNEFEGNETPWNNCKIIENQRTDRGESWNSLKATKGNHGTTSKTHRKS